MGAIFIKTSEEMLQSYIDLQTFFSVCVPVTTIDKVLFSISRGIVTPKGLINSLNISKGNLANYCRGMIEKKEIVKQKNTISRGINYQITAVGEARVKQLISKIEKERKTKGSAK